MAEIKAKLTLTTEEEIRLLQEKIQELKKEVDSMEKYKSFKKATDDVYLLKQSFVDSGFTEEQAMQMVLASIPRVSC